VVGRGAYVAAGSTITKDVAAGALAIARARQVEKPGWARARARKAALRKGGKP
jgi:bifunctional UDP-N-acetylglucosamine pyrophosphorylase/glucosamine-1-phosphate N-acetyltransferase